MIRGIIKQHYRIRENEDEDKSDSPLIKEITRITFTIGAKIESEDDTNRILRLQSALSVLSQAQTLVGVNEREARKLYNIARRLAK